MRNHNVCPMNMRRSRLFLIAAAPALRLVVVWSSKHAGTGRVVPVATPERTPSHVW